MVWEEAASGSWRTRLAVTWPQHVDQVVIAEGKARLLWRIWHFHAGFLISLRIKVCFHFAFKIVTWHFPESEAVLPSTKMFPKELRGALLTTALLRFALKQASQCYPCKTKQGWHFSCSTRCYVPAGNQVIITLGSQVILLLEQVNIPGGLRGREHGSSWGSTSVLEVCPFPSRVGGPVGP